MALIFNALVPDRTPLGGNGNRLAGAKVSVLDAGSLRAGRHVVVSESAFEEGVRQPMTTRNAAPG
jgi:hypothetical protein